MEILAISIAICIFGIAMLVIVTTKTSSAVQHLDQDSISYESRVEACTQQQRRHNIMLSQKVFDTIECGREQLTPYIKNISDWSVVNEHEDDDSVWWNFTYSFETPQTVEPLDVFIWCDYDKASDVLTYTLDWMDPVVPASDFSAFTSLESSIPIEVFGPEVASYIRHQYDGMKSICDVMFTMLE